MTAGSGRAGGAGGGGGWRYRVATDRSRPGAIGVIDLLGEAARLPEIGLPRVEPGSMELVDLWGVDRGLVVCWSSGFSQLMPHGGPAVVRAVVYELESRGVAWSDAGDDALLALHPEAADLIEARMLAALAEAQSPLAIDLLLRQPELWRRSGAKNDPERDRVLSRLIEPPLVAAVGPANIGKSTLLNTLAGRSVAAVADEPGTTRDHVGLLLEVEGLTVRYVDTPGQREGADGIEAEAAAIAAEVVAGADLVLECSGECGDDGLPTDGGCGAWGVGRGASVIRVGLRRDLGPPAGPVDVEVSALTGAGVAELAGLIRERLVPARIVEAPVPWRFWTG